MGIENQATREWLEDIIKSAEVYGNTGTMMAAYDVLQGDAPFLDYIMQWTGDGIADLVNEGHITLEDAAAYHAAWSARHAEWEREDAEDEAMQAARADMERAYGDEADDMPNPVRLDSLQPGTQFFPIGGMQALTLKGWDETGCAIVSDGEYFPHSPTRWGHDALVIPAN